MRYPDKFHITNVIETREGSDYVYEDDQTRDAFIFNGRIRKITSFKDMEGDLTKATHVIHCKVLDFDVAIGMTIYDYSDEKEYEILLSIIGQNGMKIWVSLA